MPDNKKKKTVGLLEKLGFMSFSTSTNIVFNFKSTYYKFFLTSILLIDPVAASNMALIGTAWDIINDPLIGVWANNVRFKSGERVRPWLLWIAVPYAVGMVLLLLIAKQNTDNKSSKLFFTVTFLLAIDKGCLNL